MTVLLKSMKRNHSSEMDLSSYVYDERGQNGQYRDNMANKLIALENELNALRNKVKYLERLLLNSSEAPAESTDKVNDRECNKMCAFCDGMHPICSYFQYLTVDDRWKVAKELRLCYCCLNKKHFARDCPYRTKCGINHCHLTHSQLLHDEERRQNLRTKKAERTQHRVVNPSDRQNMTCVTTGCDAMLNSEDGNDLRISGDFRETSPYGYESDKTVKYSSDINPRELAKSMLVFESTDSETDSLDSFGEESVNPECPLNLVKPSGGAMSVENTPEIDLSLWLQPLPEPEVKSVWAFHGSGVPESDLEPLDLFIETVEPMESTDNEINNAGYMNISLDGETNIFSVSEMSETHSAELIIRLDSVWPSGGEIKAMEPLAYSMRTLNPSEFAENGFETVSLKWK